MNGDQHHCQWDLFKSVSSNNVVVNFQKKLCLYHPGGYISSSCLVIFYPAMISWTFIFCDANKKEWFPGVWRRPAPLPREIRHLSLHSVAPQSPPTIHTGKPYNQVQSESLYRFQQRGIIMSNLSCVCPKDSVAPLAAFWLEGVALPSVGGLGLVGNVATIIVLRYSFMEILFCIFTTWWVALYQKLFQATWDEILVQRPADGPLHPQHHLRVHRHRRLHLCQGCHCLFLS